MKRMLKKSRSFFRHLFIPRRSNNQRSKLLHPAGLSVVVGLFLIHFSLRQLIVSLPGFVLGFASSVSVDEVINLTNQERTKQGLAPLTLNQQLTDAAYAKAADMFAKDYWAHVSPTGTQPWFFIKNSGYTYRHAGENLARDFAESTTVVQAWMNSPSHRDNLMNSKYQDIGVAVVDGTLQGVETRLVVQMFGTPTPTPLAQLPPQTQTLPPAPEVVETPQQTQPAPLETQPAPVETVISQEELIEEAQEQTGEPLAIELEATEFGKSVKKEPQAQYAGTRILQAIGGPEQEIRISPTRVTQVFGGVLVSLILGTLVIDWVIAHRRRTVRLVGRNWAHLTFLGVIILLIFQMSQGRIL